MKIEKIVSERNRTNSNRNSLKVVCAIAMMLLGAFSLHAQTDPAASAPVLFESGLTYLYICLVILVGAVCYYIMDAKRVLEKNGKSMEFSFLSFRWMAGHGNIVVILFFAVIFAAVIWAVLF